MVVHCEVRNHFDLKKKKEEEKNELSRAEKSHTEESTANGYGYTGLHSSQVCMCYKMLSNIEGILGHI